MCISNLSAREKEVAHLIAKGKIKKEIAAELFISEGTAHTHYNRIRKKLNARNIADITREYILDLDNPRLILKMLFALFLQFSALWIDYEDMRRAGRSKPPKPSEKTLKLKTARPKARRNDYKFSA